MTTIAVIICLSIIALSLYYIIQWYAESVVLEKRTAVYERQQEIIDKLQERNVYLYYQNFLLSNALKRPAISITTIGYSETSLENKTIEFVNSKK